MPTVGGGAGEGGGGLISKKGGVQLAKRGGRSGNEFPPFFPLSPKTPSPPLSPSSIFQRSSNVLYVKHSCTTSPHPSSSSSITIVSKYLFPSGKTIYFAEVVRYYYLHPYTTNHKRKKWCVTKLSRLKEMKTKPELSRLKEMKARLNQSMTDFDLSMRNF